MNALFFLHTHSLKNRLLAALRDPKFIAKALGVIIFIAVIIIGALTGVRTTAERDILVLKGVLFLVFLLPYWAGRFSGGGSYSMEDVNHVFTAPILPRTVLLSGLFKQLGGMFVIAVSIIVVIAFASTMFVISMSHILWAGLFGFILMFVCKLMGMYLFVAYRKAYRWIGLFWMGLLAGYYIIDVALTGWDWMSGLLNLLGSHLFALTPFVGWAAAGAFNFGAGYVLHGLFYMGLLLAAGVYFFVAVYKSSPDFYDETLGTPIIPDNETTQKTVPNTVEHHETENHIPHTSFPNKTGAKIFFYKHIREASRISRGGIVGTDLMVWIIFAILWGLYARDIFFDNDIFAILFIYVGVPSRSFLAPLMPLVFVVAVYPYFDRGFREYSSPYFYLVPASPRKKLLWISMSRAINVCVTAVLVLGLAGVISGTSPTVVLAAMLAYISAAFMALGVRAAAIGFFGALSGAGKNLAATLPVLFFVLVGWIGLMAIFYSGNESWVTPVAMLGFAGWCIIIGGLGFWYGARALHNLDGA